MTTPTRKTGRKGATARPAAPAAPKSSGTSQREKELELVLVAVALANGGELVVGPEHAWAASHRTDIEGIGVRYTVRGLEIEALTEDEDEFSGGLDDVATTAPVSVEPDLVDYSSNGSSSDTTPAYAGYGS